MLLMIDNYDSFTFNLVQYFAELGEDGAPDAGVVSRFRADLRSCGCSQVGRMISGVPATTSDRRRFHPVRGRWF